MNEIGKKWDSILVDLARGGISLFSLPVFLILGSAHGGLDPEIRKRLPRVPLKPINTYGADDPIQVYADRNAVFVTWTGTDLNDLRSLAVAMRASRSDWALNGITLWIPTTELQDDSGTRAAADYYQQALEALCLVLEIYVPLFVIVANRMPPSTPGSPPFVRGYFPFDLWAYHSDKSSRTAINLTPQGIKSDLVTLIDRYSIQCFCTAPALPTASRSSLEPQQRWYDRIVHIRGTLDRLAYLLRSVVIGAYDVEAQGTQPTNLLSEHTFISSQGPILLGACYLADDGAQTWDALYEDLMKNHQTVYWAELAHAKSRRRKAQLSAVRWGSIIGGGLLAVFTCLFGLGVFQRISAYRTALKLANEALQKEELDTAETETANALTQFPGNGTAIGLQSRIIKIRSAAFSKSVRALLESQEFDAAQSQVSLALKRFPKDSSFSDLESRIKLARNPEFFRRYSSHEQGKYVYVVSISPLNEWIASGDGDGNIKVTELKTGIVKDSIKTGTSAGGLFNAVTAISFNLKSDMFISGNRGGEFVCWMIKPGGKLERRWGARRDADPIGRMASSVALSPDGQYALLANHAHSIGSVLVNTSDGVEIRRFKGGPNGTRQVKFISEDTFVAVDSDGHVRKWRKESAEKPIDDVPLLDEVKNVAVSNDGTTLVHSRNISISIYDIWSNKKIQEKDLSDVKSPEVSLSSDSAFAVIAGFPSRIIYLRAWADPARADFFQPLARSEKESSALRAIISVCFSQDGKYIAGGDGDGKLWVWQLSK